MPNVSEESVQEFLESFKAAVYAKDTDRYVALYDQDACIFDIWMEWSYEGLVAWRGMVTEWFASLGDGRDRVDFNGVRISIRSDTALVYAFIKFTGLSAEGKELRSMNERLTLVLVQRNGEWKIAHQHSSAPADFTTFKILPQR